MAFFTHLQIRIGETHKLRLLDFPKLGESCHETLTRLAVRQVCFFFHPDIKDSDVREK